MSLENDENGKKNTPWCQEWFEDYKTIIIFSVAYKLID